MSKLILLTRQGRALYSAWRRRRKPDMCSDDSQVAQIHVVTAESMAMRVPKVDALLRAPFSR